MAAWSVLLWYRTIDMLEHGTDTCTIPTSPLFINCSKSSHSNPMILRTTQKKALNNPGTIWLQQDIHKNVNLSDVNIKRSKRGSYLSFSTSLRAKMYEKVKKLVKSCIDCIKPKVKKIINSCTDCVKPHPRVIMNDNSADQITATSSKYSSSVPYARVGW